MIKINNKPQTIRLHNIDFPLNIDLSILICFCNFTMLKSIFH